jgi:putative membrane protein
VARRTWRRNNEWATARGGESLLRERYARGEIDETEYRQRLQVLRVDQKVDQK